jgi:hypothetical protein
MLDPDLVLDLRDDRIVVGVPDKSYEAIFRRSADGPWLLVTSERLPDGHTVDSTAKFRASAWKAANKKARQLGWLV